MNIVVIPGANYNNAPAGFDGAVKYVTNLYDNLFSANVARGKHCCIQKPLISIAAKRARSGL
jgi:hypothetical protein